MKPHIHIIHFNPVESYPPTMNLIRYLSDNGFNGTVYTTIKPGKTFIYKVENFRFHRFGKISKFRWELYLTYIKFNFGVLLCLILKHAKIVLCYETLSILPTYYLKNLKKNSKVFIHYHEYSAPEELANASSYIKYLRKLEMKLLPHVEFTSHTNKERVDLFLKDNHLNRPSDVRIIPNYPPKSWSLDIKPKVRYSNPIRFVYVGALSLETMYVERFTEWINRKDIEAKWDIYSDNITQGALTYLTEAQKSGKIKLNNAVNYYSLPEILTKYDIGVIFYNGNIPNYVYNAPNKLFEYLVCGLDVWISKELIGCRHLIQDKFSPIVKYIDFNDITITNEQLMNHVKPYWKVPKFNYEEMNIQFVKEFIDSNK